VKSSCNKIIVGGFDMFKRNDILINPIDFDNVILFSISIEVYQTDGRHLETGVIEYQTENTIRMNGGNYLKINCMFKVGYVRNQA